MYERTQRDEYTSKIRFGLAALNSASLVTILNVGKSTLSGCTLTAGGLFAAGVILSGLALFSHQNHLVELQGDTYVRAVTLDRAVAQSGHPVGSTENSDLQGTLKELSGMIDRLFEFSVRATIFQHSAAGCWLAGLLTAGAALAGYRSMRWTELAPIFGCS